jgi:DNA-binding transcriptional regulator YhcF (GntR family)
VVDRSDRMSPYRQIANALRHKIATNQIPAATVLPSVRGLAARVGVTPATVARAYQQLQNDGLVESQVGVGTVVADTHRLVYDARQRSSEELDSAVTAALTPLLQQGFTPGEVREAVARCLERSIGLHSAVVVSDAKPVLEKYLTIMRRELMPLGVQVDGVLLSSLARGEGSACEVVRKASRVLTSLGLMRPVQEALERCESNAAISVIFTELNLATIERLSVIPKDARILLVAEERYRSSILGLLRQHLAVERITVLHDVNEATLRAALATSDVVVHSLGQSDLVLANVDDRQRVILMDYQVRRDAMAKLRESFLSEESTELA